MWKKNQTVLPVGSGDQSYRYEIFRDLEELHSARRPFFFRSPMHIHNNLEFMYVEHGSLPFTIGDVQYRIQAGQMAAVSSFVRHEIITDSPVTARLLLIPRQYLTAFGGLFNRQSFKNPVFCDDLDRSMLRMVDTIYSINHGLGIYRGFTQDQTQSLLSSLCSVFVETVIHQCGLIDQPQSSILIVEAASYIHKHFREKISIPEMAHELLCHQQTLTDQFRAAFGMTITAYINRLRAIHVHTLLRQDASMTLPEAADQAGFGSVRSMLRAYKAEFGCTPRERR